MMMQIGSGTRQTSARSLARRPQAVTDGKPARAPFALKPVAWYRPGMGSAEATINVSSTSTDWRGQALSNFGLSPFVLDGTLFASVEGFIQGIKFPEGDPRRAAAFVSSGWDAKRRGDTADRSGAYWGGERIPYGSPEHHRLIERAMRARIAQSRGLQEALRSTAGATLIHRVGTGAESPTTSLPVSVFCRILTEIRAELLVDKPWQQAKPP
jgi:predicted NAD-dependent protein-ADP-ribosyltransferase YbiA (DUF1768 family)